MTAITIERTLTQPDFNTFATISGDNNPIHVDPAFSGRTRFGRTVSHGMLLYTVLWGLVQKHYPGAKQKSQALMFPNPAYADEPLRFEIRQNEDREASYLLSMTVSRVADGAVVLEGKSEIEMPQDLQK